MVQQRSDTVVHMMPDPFPSAMGSDTALRGQMVRNRKSMLRQLQNLPRKTNPTRWGGSANFSNLPMQCGITVQSICRRIGLARDVGNFQRGIVVTVVSRADESGARNTLPTFGDI